MPKIHDIYQPRVYSRKYRKGYVHYVLYYEGEDRRFHRPHEDICYCGRPNRNKPCKHLVAAQKALQDFDRRLDRTQSYDAPIAVFFEAWLNDHQHNVDAVTVERYGRCISIFRQFCQERAVESTGMIDSQIMRDFKKWMKKQKYTTRRHTPASRMALRHTQYLTSKAHLIRTMPSAITYGDASDLQPALERERQRVVQSESYVAAKAEVDSQMETMKENYSDAYISITLRALRTAFFWAIKNSMMQAPNPLSGKDTPRADKIITDVTEEGERNPLSDDEVRKILDNTTGRLHDMAELMLNTGMRIGEVLNLPWKHVFEYTPKAYLKISPYRKWYPKWKIKRDIPLNERARQVLSRLRDAATHSEYVFCSRNATRLMDRNIEQDFRDLFDRLHITGEERKGVAPHCFRHTFATKLVYEGVTPKTIQTLMGHRSLSTTMLYFHRVERRDAEAVNKLVY